MTKNELISLSEEIFSNHNCAQAVLMTMAKYDGIYDDSLEFITGPFGGGLCGTRVSVCGAVSGGIMYIGLKEHDRAKATEDGKELLEFVENKYGHRCCEKILDIDFNDKKQVIREKDAKGETICIPLIKDICLFLADKYENKGEN